MRRLQVQVVYDEPFVATDESQGTIVADSIQSPHLLPAPALDSWRYRFVKRAFDIIGALAMLAIFLVPGILIVLAILLTSPHPVFYSEKRIGRKGVPFRIWKFRSMRPHRVAHRIAGEHSEGGVVLQWRMDKGRHDPRITMIGRFLRRWSLDEVPQVINVLRGEMSLVGPRPIVQAETHLYKNLFSFYLAATPGLSGLWQVSGRSDVGYSQRARIDAFYVQNWSLTRDFGILLRTIPAVLGRVGAR